MSTDILMSDVPLDSCEDEQQPIRNYVVAVDFGTTFSSVAYVGYTHEYQRKYIGLNQIELINEYPDWQDTNVLVQDVPTELWYPSLGHQVDGTNSFVTQEQMAEQREAPASSDDDNAPLSDTDSEDDTQQSEAPKVPSSSCATPELFWGYGVAQQLEVAQAFDPSKRVTRFKLLLHDGPESEKARALLDETCSTLRKNGLITDNIDLIAHYLEQLFKHTHSRLVEEGYTEESKVEFVLCVPAIWKARACRKMQVAMTNAIRESGFGKLQNGSIDNLFIVSEPEAAATAAVQTNKVNFRAGETVLILDAGGATVDAATYTVDGTVPLRFKTEVVELGGALCGSTYINERFEELLTRKLSEEQYLRQDGEDMSRVIDRLLAAFERRHKKKMDEMFPNNIIRYQIPVLGLRANKKKNFLPSRLCLRRSEIRELFSDSLEKVAQVMRDQILAARSKQPPCFVTKVVLMGGFGRSRSLAAHLKNVLTSDPIYDGIELEHTKLMSSAVSQGAVLRALRKEDGPDRLLQSSYGFLRSEPYKDKYVDENAHAQQTPWLDPIDGLYYIENTIRWDIHKGTVVPAERRFEKDVEYTFHNRRNNLLCKETLFVADSYPEQSASDTGHDMNAGAPLRESHYRYTHPKNAGAEVISVVEFNVSHMKNTEMVKKMPAPRRGMFPYWKVFARLSIIVNGRNMRYEVRLRDEGNDVEARAVGQESLAAAFLPGTD